MHIDFDLKSRECDIVNAICECCKEEKRQSFLRIVSVDIRCHFFAEIIMCIKCLTDKNFSIRK